MQEALGLVVFVEFNGPKSPFNGIGPAGQEFIQVAAGIAEVLLGLDQNIPKLAKFSLDIAQNLADVVGRFLDIEGLKANREGVEQGR